MKILAKLYLLCFGLFASSVFASEPLYLFDSEATSDFAWKANRFEPGKATTLLDTEGEGLIQRIWLTTSRPGPEQLEIVRSLTLRIFWDGSETPAVEAPVYDFFNQPFGPQAVNNALNTSDGRLMTFCLYLPMPFKKSARVEVQNDAKKGIQLWYECCVVKKKLPSDILYFHTQWNTTEVKDAKTSIPALRQIEGKGRYLGMHVSAVTPDTSKSWNWYTRKVSFRVDQMGTPARPSLQYGTIDDFVGSAWWSVEKNHKPFEFPYYGRHHVSRTNGGSDLRVAVYRYFIQDPIWFRKSISVAIGPKELGPSSWRVLSYFYLDRPGQAFAKVPGSTLQ